jgi:hypothetical protein
MYKFAINNVTQKKLKAAPSLTIGCRYYKNEPALRQQFLVGYQGDQMSMCKSHPNCSPIDFLSKFMYEF